MVGKGSRNYEALLDVIEDCLSVKVKIYCTQLSTVYHPAFETLADKIESLA